MSLMVSTRGANVILQDQAEYWLARAKHPGLLSCGIPNGRAKAPVGNGESPEGVGIGTASKSEPFGPVTCESGGS